MAGFPRFNGLAFKKEDIEFKLKQHGINISSKDLDSIFAKSQITRTHDEQGNIVRNASLDAELDCEELGLFFDYLGKKLDNDTDFAKLKNLEDALASVASINTIYDRAIESKGFDVEG